MNVQKGLKLFKLQSMGSECVVAWLHKLVKGVMKRRHTHANNCISTWSHKDLQLNIEYISCIAVGSSSFLTR